MDKTLRLFNVNAMIGRGAYDVPVFPTAADLIEHLDDLGIDRSLVCHVEARDLNPTRGNRRLLRELNASGYAQRLYPAWVIAPSCFYEHGAREFLKTQLASGQCRALRIFPEIGRYPVLLLERLLTELAAFRPVVFWDCGAGSEADIRDFGTLAGRFPDLTFVFTRKGMFGFGSIIDQMWRHPNICVDLIYMADYVSMLADAFGPDRILFGINRKTDYGAAVASLVHGRMPEDQRERIAHGNLERLLNLPPLTHPLAAPPALLNRKPLWDRFRRGLPLEKINIVDAHGHIGPISLGWYLRDITIEAQRDRMLEQMQRLGVRKAIVSALPALFGEALAGNLEVETRLQSHDGCFSGYLVYNPLYHEELAPAFDTFFNRGFFVGFKILPVYWKVPVTDKRFVPMWAYADRHQLPILIHTWEDACNSPAMLTEIVRAYPRAVFLLGHSGGTDRGRLEAETLALAFPNVYLEFCGSFVASRTFDQSMTVVGDDRVVFGSDSWGHDLAWELGRYLSLPVPDGRLIPGLGKTMDSITRRQK